MKRWNPTREDVEKVTQWSNNLVTTFVPVKRTYFYAVAIAEFEKNLNLIL
jgi:hypothetical protein